jgi:hypothetical protein
MAYHDKIQLTFTYIVPPDQVAEGDRLFQSHGSWMASTHHRTGEKTLLSCNVAKGPELSNPMDPNSASAGNTCFVQSEIYKIYESKAGLLDYFEQANNWGDFPAARKWIEKCKATFVTSASIIN